MNFYTGSLLFTSAASLALGIFVYLKGKERLPNITLGLFSLSLAFWCFGQFMGEAAATKALVLFWTREGIAGAIFLPVFFLHFILSLVNRTAEERKLLYVVYGLGILFLFLDFTPLFVADVSPAFGFRYYPQPGIVYLFFALFIFSCFIYGFFRLFAAYKASSGARRNQLLYVLFAVLIGFAGGITAFFPVFAVNFPVLSHFTLPIYVLITVYAILKHQLLDVSVIVREGLVYSTLTLLFAGFYVFAVLVANYFVSSFVQLNPSAAIISVVFLSVLVFQPLRDRVQKGVDKVFFRGEFRYQKTIDDLSEENRKLFRSLLQADKLAALGTLSAGMAHEIKNPLASIKGMTQVLHENLDDPEFVREYQGVIDRQVNRINSLVEKLLKFGQPPKLSLTEFDLNAIIEEALSLVSSQAKKEHISLTKDLAVLPRIKGDAEQLAQVFTNLFLNAIQAMPKGGVLSVKAEVRGPLSVYIEVSDTGAGVAADKLDKLFDPFFTTRDEGTGMGLAVAYRAIKEHNGEIQVESIEGRGTKFKLWLPIRPEQSA